MDILVTHVRRKAHDRLPAHWNRQRFATLARVISFGLYDLVDHRAESHAPACSDPAGPDHSEFTLHLVE